MKKQQLEEEMFRINKLLMNEELEVSEEIEDIVHFYCQQHKKNGGISRKGWKHAVTFEKIIHEK